MSEEQKIKPFYIDAKKHNLPMVHANDLLRYFIEAGAYDSGIRYQGLGSFNTINGKPYLGVCDDGGEAFTFLCERCDLDGETEITPEDVPTWLKHRQKLQDYNSWKDVQESLKDQVAASEVDFPQKPTLGLLPRKQWVINRQYDIVRALARQAEACELLDEDWVEELVELIGEE